MLNGNTTTPSTLTLSPTGTSTFGGTIQGGGALGTLALAINGSGTQVLTGVNTYTGGTQINAGILNINGDAALGDVSSTLTFTGSGTLQAGVNGITLSPNRAITLNSGVTGAIDTQAFNMSIAGPIGGPGSLNKVGSGILTLTGSSNYSGQTNVSGGTLQVGNGGSGASIGGAGVVNLVNNSALVFNHADNVTFAAAITGSGSFTKRAPAL